MKNGIKLINDNMELMMFCINKYLSKHECVESYADYDKYPKQLNKMGILDDDMKNIERSQTGYILNSKYQIRIEPNYGIIVNCDKASAFIIHLGYRVIINPNKFQIKGYSTTINHSFTEVFKPCFEIENEKLAFESSLGTELHILNG